MSVDTTEDSIFTLEELAQDYNLPELTGLFNQKAEGAVVLQFKKFTLEACDMKERDALIVFNYRDDLPGENEGDLRTGFELALIDAKTHDLHIAAFHAEDRPGSKKFDLQGGLVSKTFNEMKALEMAGGPLRVMLYVTGLVPSNGEAYEKPTIH